MMVDNPTLKTNGAASTQNPSHPARIGERVDRRRVAVWDSATLSSPPADALFNPLTWRDEGKVLGEAEGRGASHFLRAATDTCWVLRHYRRGGALARFNRDRYLWTGSEHARPVRELRLLAALYNRGLPVPRPVAARAIRRGLTYSADLITVAIPQAEPLAERLMRAPMPVSGWHAIGAVIAELHRAGVWHADLNARNALTVDEATFYLIDFDRARFRRDGTWREGNLKRFRRSLDKFAATGPMFHFVEADWRTLVDGYRAAFSDLRGL